MRTGAERNELLQLPHTVEILETQAHNLAQVLGSEQFFDASGKLLVSVYFFFCGVYF